MTTKTFIKENILSIVIALLLIIVVVQNLNKEESKPERYNEEFCVQWEDGLTRELLVYKCYNFLKQEIQCDWIIAPDYLILLNYTTDEVLSYHNCTWYVPSRIANVPIDMENIEDEVLT